MSRHRRWSGASVALPWTVAAAFALASLPAPVARAGGPLEIQCGPPSHPISPMVYGIAFHPRRDHQDRYLWDLNPGARRWGGNPSSRFNWRLGNAWNTGADWFFMNVNYTEDPTFRWSRFLRDNLDKGVGTALTLPMLGWVAKDTESHSYPVSVFGPQRQAAPYRADAGDGFLPNGRRVGPTDPRRTSVPLPPSEVGAWVRAIRGMDRERGRRHVQLYLLDNEPMLWHETHADVRAEPLGYDELLERTVRYASAVRAADPEGLIGGPAAWGWPAYFFSAVDAEAGFRRKPDRRRHGDEPLLRWYLRELRAHHRRTGVRLLDILDVHYYPQADGVFLNQRTDPATAALRIRSTRSLWDPSYRDESWIDEPVALLPRMETLIRDSSPGLRLAIGEYNFGGEDHISGALALAEALGRFGRAPILLAAFYWTYPPEGSPAYWAFRAFRNFDGKGARFAEHSLPARDDPGLSLFAARDEPAGRAPQRVTAVAVHHEGAQARPVQVKLRGCPASGTIRTYRYVAGAPGLAPAGGARLAEAELTDLLPPQSITVYELRFASPGPGGR